MEITINQKKYSDMWCPMARLSLQYITNGGNGIPAKAEMLPVSFNQTLTANDNKINFPARCQGEVCPFYKKPFLGKIGWGGCRFCQHATGWGVLIPLWIIAFTTLAAVYLKYFGGA